MRKAVICLLLFLPILVSVARVGSEAGTDPGLTRGVEILYEKDRLEKEAAPGESVLFSHLDFLACSGERELDGVIIRETPSPGEGVLYLGSDPVSGGAFIPAEYLERLQFVPADGAVESASFRFSLEDGGAVRTCVIRYSFIPSAALRGSGS